MTALPIDDSTIEAAIRTWVSDAMELPLGSVVWTGGDVPQLDRPFAWLFYVSGPRETASMEEIDYAATMLSRATVTTAVAGQVYSLRIHEGHDPTGIAEGELYSYTAQVGDDVDAIRDELVALVNAEGWPTAVADDENAGAMLLAGDLDTSRRRFTLEPSAGITVVNLFDGHGVITRQDAEITFRLQVETDSQQAGATGRALLSRARADLNTRARSDRLRDAGLVFRRSGTPLDVSAVLNAAYVHRGSQDFIFAVRTQVAETRRFIRRVGVTVTATE